MLSFLGLGDFIESFHRATATAQVVILHPSVISQMSSENLDVSLSYPLIMIHNTKPE
jgi:hypothetical protein